MSEQIRNSISVEEFDYQTLVHALQSYAKPRDKISTLLKKRVIIRVKKGLYIFGDNYRRSSYSKELLANLIYGPSYLSLEFALHYYGMIPELVRACTSVCIGRSRRFSTPIGLYLYKSIPLAAFSSGVTVVKLSNDRSFLIANSEKALADKLHFTHGLKITTQVELEYYLIENLRIDLELLSTLTLSKIDEYAKLYRSQKIRLLYRLLLKIGKNQ